MAWSLWFALLGAAVLISLTPGAGAINTMANSIGVGWARSIWGILGQQLALLVHIAIVAAGVGLLVSESPTLFNVVRYSGAAYLVFLGIRQFRSRGDGTEEGPMDHQRASHSCSRGITRSPYSSSRAALDSYQNGRSQPAASKNTAPSSCCEACIGAVRRGRSDSYCSAGCTMP